MQTSNDTGPNIAGYFNGAAWQRVYLASLEPAEQLCYSYLKDRADQGKTYVSLRIMAEKLELTEDQCDNAMVRFRVDRSLPLFVILEESEG